MSQVSYRKLLDGTWCIVSDSNKLCGDVVVTTKDGIRKVETIISAVGFYRDTYIYDFVQKPREEKSDAGRLRALGRAIVGY